MDKLKKYLHSVCPDADKIYRDEDDGINLTLFDMELDPFSCHWDGGAWVIDTDGYHHLALSMENIRVLNRVSELIETGEIFKMEPVIEIDELF